MKACVGITASGIIHNRFKARFAQSRQYFKSFRLYAVAECHDENIRIVYRFRQQILHFQREQHTFKPCGKSYGRSRLAAAFLNQTVIAAAAEYGTLCAERNVFQFKRRFRIIVQTAYQTRVQFKINAGCC